MLQCDVSDAPPATGDVDQECATARIMERSPVRFVVHGLMAPPNSYSDTVSLVGSMMAMN